MNEAVARSEPLIVAQDDTPGSMDKMEEPCFPDKFKELRRTKEDFAFFGTTTNAEAQA
jgi:hypothetical protein